MNVVKSILHPMKKFSKGIFALWTLYGLLVFSIFIFNSCKKSIYEGSDDGKSNAKFMSALDLNKKSIGSIPFGKQSHSRTVANARNIDPGGDVEPIYLNFPN